MDTELLFVTKIIKDQARNKLTRDFMNVRQIICLNNKVKYKINTCF